MCFRNQLYTVKEFIICRNRGKSKTIHRKKNCSDRRVCWMKNGEQEDGRESMRTEWKLCWLGAGITDILYTLQIFDVGVIQGFTG